MDVFVARQPIFDKHRRVYGYELLYRNGTDNQFPKGTNFDAASSQVIQNTLSAFDLDHLVPGKRAFVNITRRVLVSEMFRLLPRDRVVIELLETIEADLEVLDVCQRARRDGYILALDDFVLRPQFGPLLTVADIVKVDFMATPPAMRKDLAERLRGRPLQLLAEKVETEGEVEEAAAIGYTYFQGYFFCRPEILTVGDIPPSKLGWLRILSELQRYPTDFNRLEAIIRQDVALPVKLLRLINSAGFGLGSKITSMRHALTLLGEDNFRRWASLVALASLAENRPAELFQTSLIRGRLCESLGKAAGMRHQVDLFLMAMLSVVDAVLGRPLGEVLDKLGLAPELKDTLLAFAQNTEDADLMRPETSTLRSAYALTLACERALWDAAEVHCQELRLPSTKVAEMCMEAIVWAENTVKMT